MSASLSPKILREFFEEDFVSTLLFFNPYQNVLILSAFKLGFCGNFRDLVWMSRIKAPTVRSKVIGFSRLLERSWKIEGREELVRFFEKIEDEVLSTSRLKKEAKK